MCGSVCSLSGECLASHGFVDSFSTSAKLHVSGGTRSDRITGWDRHELFLLGQFIFHLRLTTGAATIASAPLSECFLDASSPTPSAVLSTILHTGFPAAGQYDGRDCGVLAGCSSIACIIPGDITSSGCG